MEYIAKAAVEALLEEAVATAAHAARDARSHEAWHKALGAWDQAAALQRAVRGLPTQEVTISTTKEGRTDEKF